MFRHLMIITMLAMPSIGFSASGGMDEVLLKSDSASEAQLDAAAEQMVTAEMKKIDAKADVKASDQKKVETTDAKVATAEPTLKEDQIKVLTEEKYKKSETNSPWFRLIGGALFMLVFAGVLIFAVRKYSKRANVGGKKAKIEVLHQHFLGPKKSVVLIQVAGEAILIGVTDNNINMIKSVALIDDEMTAENPDFHGYLDEEQFTVENLTAQRSRGRLV
jgi:flagellar protein FliO/FliZ